MVKSDDHPRDTEGNGAINICAVNPSDDLSRLPLIEDFAVELRLRHVEFTSGGERIAWFPAWEEAQRDLPHMTPQDIPLGTAEEPYEDADDAWRITIFEEGEYVYVFEADHPRAEEYPRAFRVQRDDYVMSWVTLLTEYNPIEPLGD